MEGASCCLSAASSTVHRRLSCGEDELGITNHIQQGEGGEQRSCSHLRSTQHWLRFPKGCRKVNSSLRLGQSLHQVSSEPHSGLPPHCAPGVVEPLQDFVEPREDPGMEQGRFLPTWMRGSPRSSSIGRPWDSRVEGRCRVAAFPTRHQDLGHPRRTAEYIEHFLDVRVTCQAEFLQRTLL